MAIKKHTGKMQTIGLLILCFFLFLTGCERMNGGALGSEANWENGQGELSNQIGSPDSGDKELIVPTYADFISSKDIIRKTEYAVPTGKWFFYDGKGKFGYGLSSGTIKAGEAFVINLFAHEKAGVTMDRDMRIQLSERTNDYHKKELIMEEVIHVGTIKAEEKVFADYLPDKENVVYLLSAEILDQDGNVEDTMVSVIYVPTPEINARLTTDKDVYQSSDEAATLTLENFGPTFLSLGTHYTIEKKVDNRWKVVPLERSFEDIGLHLNPRDQYEQTVELDQLTPGEYRVVKKFSVVGIDLSATLAAEITVE